mgnify:CR=1 FL=1
MKNKTLSLLDAENLTAGPIRTATRVRELREELDSTVGALGLTVCGVSAAPELFHFHAAWSGVRLVHEKGTNGAERAIEEFMLQHYPVGSLERLVILSGDHYFTNLAGRYKADGAWIDVVAREGSLSQQLRDIADRVTLLPRLAYAA